MKAIVLRGFGGVNNFADVDLPTPDPKPGEVRVRVRAVAINPIDYKYRQGRFGGKLPMVLGFDAAGGVLFTRFLKSPALTAAAARTSANRARIAALLRRLHGIDASPPVFDAAGVAKEYVEAAESLGALAVEDRPLAEEFLRLAEDYGERHPATVVCHNDLHAANILDGGGLVLVDFEFAVLASPLLDLASVAALNDYTASDQGDLLRAYFAGAEPPLSAAEFAKVVRLVRLMAHFWILATARGTERSELLARFGGVAMTTRNTKWQSG